MAFAADAQAAVDAAFMEFGRSATFSALTRAGPPETFAAPVTVVVVPTTRDALAGGFSQTTLRADERLVTLKASEAASPKRGDKLVMDSVVYRINSDPERRDRFGLVWTIGLRSEL